jgi:hypothetical protein
MRTEADGDPAIGELMAAGDSDELCRPLLASPWGWGSSTRHQEAVSLLRGFNGRGKLPGSLVALLLCTCHRWDRVTAKLIAAIEDSGVLSGPDLDELDESLLSDEVVAVFPLAWVSREWLEFGTGDGTTRTVKVSDETIVRQTRRVEPPLRRRAAARTLRNDPGRLGGLLERAEVLPPRHRDVLLHGLLDAADAWKGASAPNWWAGGCAAVSPTFAGPRWTGFASSTGPPAALRRAASDADRTVWAWRLPGEVGPGRRSCQAWRYRPVKGYGPSGTDCGRGPAGIRSLARLVWFDGC